jgi:hypothetical protein
MRPVEEEEALEDGPADDLLDGLDDMPVEVRERIQAELEPQYEDGMHARARELRSPEQMQRAAERRLRLLVEDMNGRYEVLDADTEVRRHLAADMVVEAFRAWLNLTPNRVMSEALAWDSHDVHGAILFLHFSYASSSASVAVTVTRVSISLQPTPSIRACWMNHCCSVTCSYVIVRKNLLEGVDGANSPIWRALLWLTPIERA